MHYIANCCFALLLLFNHICLIVLKALSGISSIVWEYLGLFCLLIMMGFYNIMYPVYVLCCCYEYIKMCVYIKF